MKKILTFPIVRAMFRTARFPTDRLRRRQSVPITMPARFVKRALWWDGLAKMERGEFERTARDLDGRLAILRTLVTEAGAS